MNLNLFLIVREAQKHDQTAQGFTGNSLRRERFNQLCKRLLCNQKDLISLFFSEISKHFLFLREPNRSIDLFVFVLESEMHQP